VKSNSTIHLQINYIYVFENENITNNIKGINVEKNLQIPTLLTGVGAYFLPLVQVVKEISGIPD
jgi:hypothetical protein